MILSWIRLKEEIEFRDYKVLSVRFNLADLAKFLLNNVIREEMNLHDLATIRGT